MSEKMSSQLERGKIPMGRPKFIRHILPPPPLKKQRIKEHNIENFNTKHNTNQSELMCSGSVDICSSRCDTRRAAHTCTFALFSLQLEEKVSKLENLFLEFYL